MNFKRLPREAIFPFHRLTGAIQRAIPYGAKSASSSTSDLTGVARAASGRARGFGPPAEPAAKTPQSEMFDAIIRTFCSSRRAMIVTK